MLAGMIIGAALVVATFIVLRIGDIGTAGRSWRGMAAVALGIVAVIVTVVVSPGHRRDPGAPGLPGGLTMNELARASASLLEPEPARRGPERIASVPSLIDGLRQRLEADPSDVRGWALLAQSYAFVGDTADAEQAVVRAVALGFDETDLRRRVASAERDPHAGLPGFARAD